MSTVPVSSPEQHTLRLPLERVGSRASQGIAWSSIFFAVLQSICTFFVALDWFRVAIGISSFTLSASIGKALDRFHADWIRIPMIVLALSGALLNLVILVQVLHLRNRPAAQWRRVPLTTRKIWSERLQWTLAVGTVFLVGLEEFLHIRWSGHL